MKLSELAQRSGVSLPSIKYYLREGLLEPGQPVTARSASYSEAHLKRLSLIRVLIVTVGLSIAGTKEVLAAVDASGDDLLSSLGRGLAALPPDLIAESSGEAVTTPLTVLALQDRYGEGDPNVAQLLQALAAAEKAGLPMGEEKLNRYRGLITELARIDIADMPSDPAQAVEYAIIGTAVYDRIISALWRLAHRELAEERLMPGHPE